MFSLPRSKNLVWTVCLLAIASTSGQTPAREDSPAGQPQANQSAAQTSPLIDPAGGRYEPNVPPLVDNYPLTPDSEPQPGVEPGKTFHFQLTNSKVFPNTERTITVFVPSSYRPGKPAVLWLQLDGLNEPTKNTINNLVAKHEVPMMIAIGVAPGTVPAASGNENPRLQRSFEFDGQSDRLARFLIDDVVPAVEAHTMIGGDPIRFSRDPNDHCISGDSTGGIAAFTAAFQRPDLFRRVYTVIGTFVGMRGGEQLEVTVRKTEPRPIRVFMVDGAHDEWPGGPEMGDWHMSNLTMNRALEFAGYDVRHVWGFGTHNDRQGEQVRPEAMRWLFRNYPQPVSAKAPGNPRLAELLIGGQEWRQTTKAPGSNDSVGLNGLPYKIEPEGGIRGDSGKLLGENLHVLAFTARANGDLLLASRSHNGTAALWRVAPDGMETKLADGLHGATALAFSPDGRWLIVADGTGQHGLDFRVKTDGSVDAPEPLYQFAIPPTAEDSGVMALCFDTIGRLYAATRMGVEIFDRNGRVVAILPAPENERVVDISFGGMGMHDLYIRTESGKLFTRTLHAAGVRPDSSPIELPKGSAG